MYDQWNRIRQRNRELNILTVQRTVSVLEMHTNTGHLLLYKYSHPR